MKNFFYFVFVNSNYFCSDDQEIDIDDMSKDKVYVKFRNRNIFGENLFFSKFFFLSLMFFSLVFFFLVFCDEKR